MPLLFQGHTELLEEYLSRSREHQAAFVQLVDQLIDSDCNTDTIIRYYHRLCRYHIMYHYLSLIPKSQYHWPQLPIWAMSSEDEDQGAYVQLVHCSVG